MAGEQIVEQAPQITEVMPADPSNNVQAEQPVSALFPRLLIICPFAEKYKFLRTDGWPYRGRNLKHRWPPSPCDFEVVKKHLANAAAVDVLRVAAKHPNWSRIRDAWKGWYVGWRLYSEKIILR
jgi:hypothetical protein